MVQSAASNSPLSQIENRKLETQIAEVRMGVVLSPPDRAQCSPNQAEKEEHPPLSHNVPV